MTRKLGVALTWHYHRWEELLALVRHAEGCGYAAAYVDGDISMLEVREETDVLDGWTVTTALLAGTSTIQIGSIRLVHHWNAARLAQAAATAERLWPGRLRFLISIGDRPNDERFGLEQPDVRARIEWLDETLTAVRALWRGDDVTLHGRYVKLDAARVRPTPPRGHIPIEIGAKSPRLLELVARHADRWDVNLPPLKARVDAAAASLDAAARRAGRDAAAIERTMWIFARVTDRAGRPDAAEALAEYRRLHPWFAAIPDDEIHDAIVLGPPDSCRQRLRQLCDQLSLELPVLDLAGLDFDATRRTLDALAPAAAPRGD